MHGVCVNRHLQHSCCIWERHRRWSVEMGKSKHHLLKHLLGNFFLPPLQTKSTIQILNQHCAHCKNMHSVIIPHAVKVQVQNQSSGVEEVILHRFNKMTRQISTEQQQKPSATNHLKHLWKRNSCLVTAPLNHCGSSSTWAATWVLLGPCAVDLQKRFTRLLCSPCSNYRKTCTTVML